MRRLLFSVATGVPFSLLGFGFAWAVSEKLPAWLQPVAVYAFSPGYFVGMLLEGFVDLGRSEVTEVLGWLLFYAINAAFWVAVFYGVATIYVRRRERRAAS